MYENYKHQGRKLSEWAKALNYVFSLGELYQLAKDGRDFYKLMGHKEYDIELGKQYIIQEVHENEIYEEGQQGFDRGSEHFKWS